mmetsp:Transcript_105162/g.282587  ORF Transcript_105162/g.282587 Transcript_105162/m.282587 type:complete len:270 (+) Transcript_105162:230-1039(+)
MTEPVEPPEAASVASSCAAWLCGAGFTSGLAFFRSGKRGRPTLCRARFSVFFSSMAIVIGPTPPGTGVIHEAMPWAAAKSTSPTRRCPSFFEASSTALMPTSMTTQPGFSHSPFTKLALPMAATTMSASRMKDTMSFVREWHTVTVASMDCRSCDTGMPTMLDLPMTTAFLPATSMPERWMSSMQPAGVQGTASGGSPPFRQRLPMFMAEKPSASFSTLMAFNIVASSMCFGSGSCTRMACTLGSLLSLSTSASSSAWLAVSSSVTSTV